MKRNWWWKWRLARKQGLPYAIRLTLDRFVPEAIFSFCSVVIVDAYELKPVRKPKADLAFGWATLERIKELRGPEDQLNFVRSELEAGHRVFMAERKGELVGCNEHNFGAFEQDSWLLYELPPQSVWGGGAWVSPELRGRSLYPLMWLLAIEDLKKEGYTHFIGEIDALNKSARRANRKIGFREVGRLFHVRLLGFAFIRGPKFMKLGWWYSGRRCRIPLSIFSNSQYAQADSRTLPTVGCR